MMIRTTLILFLLAGMLGRASAEPLQVFLLAGQSNMEGHAHVRVLDYLGDDPETAPLLAAMKNPDGSHRLIEDTWISYQTGESGRIDGGNREVFGQLTAGFGNQGRRDYEKPGEKIGPELAFGITMQEKLKQPILIIKTAWGGQSVHTDFRSPSSGPYVPTEDDIKRGKFASEEDKAALKAKTGARYRQMVEHVDFVLKDISRVYPGYDPKQGYELAGFAFFQGFNDMVNRGVYPEPEKGSETPRFAKYTEWLANMIRDLRKDLKTPDLPVAIGIMGVSGAQANEGNLAFRESQAAVAEIPEFQGSVVAVPTAPFWDEKVALIDEKRNRIRQKSYFLNKNHAQHENADGKLTPKEKKEILEKFEKEIFTEEDYALEERAKSNAGYHYLGSAKTYSLIGKALAEALLELR